VGRISIDRCGRAAGAVLQALDLSSKGSAARRSAANAGSVMLPADGGGSTQTCPVYLGIFADQDFVILFFDQRGWRDAFLFCGNLSFCEVV